MRLTFTKKPTGKKPEEYVVMNKKNQPLGEIVFWKCAGKEDWWFFPHFNPMDGENDFWMGEDCLREIADFIEKLKDASKGGEE